MSEKQIPCPHCQQSVTLAPEQRGSVIACTHCGKEFAVGGEKGAGGRKVGNYEIIERVGTGSMGVVYRARDLGDQKIVALKLLKTSLAEAETFIRRFHREADAAQNFDHSYLVKAFDHGEADGYHYYAMEFVEGEDLEQKLRRGEKVEEGQALYVARCVAEGLKYAWEKKIVHRDIKPGNIMIQTDGRIRLMDMGLAKNVSDDSATVTQAGGVLGSPAYAAPEQLQGEVDVDVRADLYGLGTTLFHLACGRQPFVGESAGVVASNNLSQPLPDPHEFSPELSEGFCAFLGRLTEKAPKRRYQTPDEVIEAIDRTAAGEMPHKVKAKIHRTQRVARVKAQEPDKVRKMIPIFVAVSLVLGLISGAIILWQLAASRRSSSSEPSSRSRAGALPKLPKVGAITIRDILHGSLQGADDEQLEAKYDFGTVSQLRDWSYRGQAPGELACRGKGKLLNARFRGAEFQVECDAILVEGTSLGITVFDPKKPNGFSVTLLAASPDGAFLQSRSKAGEDPVSSSKAKGAAPHEKVHLSLQIHEKKVVARSGKRSFSLAAPAPKTVAIVAHAGDGGTAVFDDLRVQGRIDAVWANDEMTREKNRRDLRRAMQYQGGNKALALTAGSAVKLPGGLAAMQEWTIEAYVQLYRCSASAVAYPPLFLFKRPEGEPDRLDIGPESGRARLFAAGAGPDSPCLQGFVPLAIARWHHVAVTNNQKLIRLFVDGVLESTMPASTELFQEGAPAAMTVGDPGMKDGNSTILVDDFRISNKVVYRGLSFVPQPPRKPEKRNWLHFNFTEGKGEVARNAVSKARNGKIVSGKWVRADEVSRAAETLSRTASRLRKSGRTFIAPGDGLWRDTGIYVPEGHKVSVKVAASQKSSRKQSKAPSGGRRPLGERTPPGRSLKGSIGPPREGAASPAAGKPFEIPDKAVVAAPQSGMLYLKNGAVAADGPTAIVLVEFLELPKP